MMENNTEKAFSPDLKIVEAVRSRWSNINWLLVSVGVLGLFGYWFVVALIRWLQEGGLWLTLTLVFSGIVALVTYGMLSDSVETVLRRRKLQREGVAADARIVGREVEEVGEGEMYYIYYQFRPDFVVKYHDITWNQNYFKMPLGSTLPIRYLAENVEVNGLGFL
jgi:hypothetical protein